MADTPWCGSQADKLYLQSGQFTSTLKKSRYIGDIDTAPTGIEWDGADTPWIGFQADKLYLQSGQFTSALKTSEKVSNIDIQPSGISSDRNNTPWVGTQAQKLYLQSGQFASTIKRSYSVLALDLLPSDISFDGINTPWSGIFGGPFNAKLVLQSGQFSSTVKAILNVGSIDQVPTGISWDGTNIPWCGSQADKLYLQSGQFTSTLKRSEYIGGIDTIINGISTNNYGGRIGTIFENVIDTLTLTDDYLLTNTHAKRCTEIRYWPRWIFASTSKHFAGIIERAGYTFLIEGTYRDSDLQKFIEFRLDGPSMVRLNRSYYRLDVNINLLWSFNQDHNNIYTPARMRGLLVRAMRDICIYRYGNNDSQLGILKLKNTISVNNFGRVRTDVQLIQGTVEGTFEMFLTC